MCFSFTPPHSDPHWAHTFQAMKIGAYVAWIVPFRFRNVVPAHLFTYHHKGVLR